MATYGGPAGPFLPRYTGLPYRVRQLQYVYFLETAAVRPTLLRAGHVRRGFKTFDRIETLVEGDLVVFELDRDSHLPARIETSRKTSLPPPRPGMAPSDAASVVYELDTYVEVSGIRVPGRVKLGGMPPSPDATVDSWRRAAGSERPASGRASDLNRGW